MKTCIIGYTGFVGLNLIRTRRFDDYYNSKNISQIIGRKYDQIYFCGLPGLVWYANKHPEEDLNRVNKLIDILKQVRCGQFILISTINVYPQFDLKVAEDFQPTIETVTEPYGKHRLMFEEFVRKRYAQHYIFRLPGIFGYHLKKGIIFDLLNQNYLNGIIPDDQFQFYHLGNLNQDIEAGLARGSRVTNLFPAPIKCSQLIKTCFNEYFLGPNRDIISYQGKVTSLDLKRAPKVYDLYTKFAGDHTKFATENYLCSGPQALLKVNRYLQQNTQMRIKMRNHLMVSNIAWDDPLDSRMLSLLQQYNLGYLEFAPTKIAPWDQLNVTTIRKFCDELKKYCLEPYSMQSITFGKNELQLFGDATSRQGLIDHLKHLVDLFSPFGVKRIIFGCPKNRNCPEEMDADTAFEIATNFFRTIGDYAWKHQMVVVLETMTKKYNCNYLNTMKEAVAIIKEVASPGFQLHIDSGNLYMEAEDPVEVTNYKSLIKHVQISQFGLDNFDHLPINYNRDVASSLREIGYNGKISLEMKSSGKIEKDLVNIENGLKLIETLYLS